MVTATTKKVAPKAPPAPRKLDLACGQAKTKGFKGIDISGDADITHDLFSFPWPIKTSSVSEIVCNHFVEHIPHFGLQVNGERTQPGDPDGWFLFFDEVHRILKKGGTATFVHPYAQSARADWDPTHTRRIHELTWYYLTSEWREENGLDHYPIKADFEIVNIDGAGIPDEVMARSIEQQIYQRTHYWNVIGDLHVIIKARK